MYIDHIRFAFCFKRIEIECENRNRLHINKFTIVKFHFDYWKCISAIYTFQKIFEYYFFVITFHAGNEHSERKVYLKIFNQKDQKKIISYKYYFFYYILQILIYFYIYL